MRKNNNFVTNLTVWLIKNIWQKYIGFLYNKKRRIICRFYPTCSEYAILVLNKYGIFKGIFLATDRIKRCNINNTDSCFDYPNYQEGGDKK